MESPQPTPQKSDAQTVLVVEDYDGIRLLLKGHLEKSGYRVLEASDGAEAVEIARAECDSLRLVLMDLNLGSVDGLTATKEIRRIKELCDVPIVACTARSSEEQKAKALEAGCTDLVAKPIDKKTIETILDKYLTEGKASAQIEN
ncbi:MAG: response regulator [Acidobacteriota bacterium]|nr:response regulator [Acidobacteriota bacterium]